MKTLRITTAATQDLNEISDYFLAQSIDAGDLFVTSFGQKCLYLARYP
jgi:toxin ParE1/3/4